MGPRMYDQGTRRTGGERVKRQAFTGFRLKWLLIAFVPLSIAWAFYYRHTEQRERIQRAYDRMNALVFDAHFTPNGDCVLFARNGNLSDPDLKALIPIGSGEARMGSHKVIRMELGGSKVSD